MMGPLKDIQPLLGAIRAEKQAIAYYARAAARITNPTGKAALLKIKGEEEKHYRNLRKKFKKIAGREPLPEEETAPTQISHLTEEHLPDREASDLEVCQVAIKDEHDAHGYYLQSAKHTADPEAKKLYEELAKEETGHVAVLHGICKILSKKI